ncbi:MAG: tape measure protein [Hydrogenibacillus schlegelii]|nr:tape measure protein [Hydrogenibacillus schlegelii]
MALRNYLIQFSVQNEQIIAKLNQTTKALARFERSATYHLRGVHRQLGTIRNAAVALGAMAVVARVGEAIRSAIEPALSRIDTIERFSVSLTAITGSSEVANRALKVLKDTVTDTPFRLDTAAEAAQNFVLRGIDLARSIAYVRAAADAVAFYGDGTDDTLQNITDAMAIMLTQGKVTMDQMERLYTRGIPAVDLYARAVGRSAAEVTKDLQDGKITAKQFFDTLTLAWQKGMGGVQKIDGAAKEAARSWAATFGNFRARVAIAVAEFIQTVDNALKKAGLPDMRTMILQTAAVIQRAVRLAAQYAEPVIMALGTIVRILRELQAALTPIMPLIKIALAAWLSLIVVPAIYGAITSRVAGLIEGLVNLNRVAIQNASVMLTAAARMAAPYTVIRDASGKFKRGVMTTEIALKQASQATASFGAALSRLAPMLRRVPLFALATAATYVAGVWLSVGRSWSATWHTMAAHAWSAAASILRAIAGILGAFGKLVPFAGSAASAVSSWAKQAEAAANRHRAAIEQVTTGFGDWRKLEEESKKAAESAFGGIKDGAENAAEAADKAAKAAKGQLAAFDELHVLSKETGAGDVKIPEIDVPEFEIPGFDGLTERLSEATGKAEELKSIFSDLFRFDMSPLEEGFIKAVAIINRLKGLSPLRFVVRVAEEVFAPIVDWLRKHNPLRFAVWLTEKVFLPVVDWLRKHNPLKFFVWLFEKIGDLNFVKWLKETRLFKFIVHLFERIGDLNFVKWLKETRLFKFFVHLFENVSKLEWLKKLKDGAVEVALKIGKVILDNPIAQFLLKTGAKVIEFVIKLANPVGWLFDILDAVDTLRKNTEFLEGKFETMKKRFEEMGKGLRRVLEGDVIGGLKDFIKSLSGLDLDLREVATKLAHDFIDTWTLGLVSRLEEKAPSIGKIFQGFLSGLVSGGGAGGVIGGFKAAVEEGTGFIRDKLGGGRTGGQTSNSFGDFRRYEEVSSKYPELGNVKTMGFTNISFDVEGLKERIASALDSARAYTSQKIEEIKASLGQGWDAVKQKTADTWNAIKDGIAAAWSVITGNLSAAWNALRGAAASAFEGLKQTISGVWESIKGAASSAWSAITGALSSVWQTIRNTAATVFEGIKQTIGNVWETIKGAASAAWGAITGALSAAWNTIKTTASTVFSAVGQVIGTVWTTIQTNASAVWGAITGALSAIWTNIKNIATTAFDGVKNIIANVWSAIQSTAAAIWGAITASLSGTWETIKGLATAAFDGVRNIIVGAFQTAQTLIQSIWNNISATLSGIWENIKGTAIQKFNALKDGVIGILTDLTGRISRALSDALAAVRNFAADVKSRIDDAANYVGTKAREIWSNLTSTVSNAYNRLTGKSTSSSSNSKSSSTTTNVKKMASGGIVTAPTFALVGEAGPEAVVPLSRDNVLVAGIRDAVYEAVAMALSQAMVRSGGGGEQREIVIELNGRELARAVIDDLSVLSRRLGVRFS